MQKVEMEIVGGILCFRAVLDGVAGYLAFDTGSQCSVLYHKYFASHESAQLAKKEATIVSQEKVKTTDGVSGSVTIAHLTAGEFTLENFSAKLFDVGYVEAPLQQLKPGLTFLGTIGMDFIAKHVITIHYPESCLYIDDAPITAPDACAITFSSKGLILAAVDCEGAPYTFIVDTGASTCLIDNTLKDALVQTVVKEDKNVYQMKPIRFMNRTYENLSCIGLAFDRLSDNGTIAGILGYPCIKDKVLTIDCPHQKLLLA